MKLKIRRKHIKRGKRDDQEACPIALALIEAGFEDVSVDQFYWCSDVGTFPMPKKAVRFVDDFDMGNRVEPFEMTVINPKLATPRGGE